MGIPDVFDTTGLIPWVASTKPTQIHTGKSGMVLSTRLWEQLANPRLMPLHQLQGGERELKSEKGQLQCSQ